MRYDVAVIGGALMGSSVAYFTKTLDPSCSVCVIEPDPTPLLDETPHVRTSASHIEDLAAKPVSQVVAAVSDLSTDELRLLTEHELAHKNRRTVLTAIEKALAPTPV